MKTRFEHSAGGVLLREGAEGPEVALAARRDRRGELVWGLPKGLVEGEEDPQEAAVREVREETGFVAEIERGLGDISYWFVWGGTRIRKVVTFFLMRAIGGDPSERDHEMEDVRWFPLADALDLAGYASERGVLRRAAEAIGTGPSTSNAEASDLRTPDAP